MSYVTNAQKGMPKFITGRHGNPKTKTANTLYTDNQLDAAITVY